MSAANERDDRIMRMISEHRGVLNRLEPHLGCVVCRGPLTAGRCLACDPIDPRCAHRFPLPSWMGPDQDTPCRCDLPVGHDGRHECRHLRAEKAR